MRKYALYVAMLAAAFVASLNVTPAQAQATRTWVSGVGDDANPCSRTAPCKTFAGAISKTATGGEINCLDPGGFGAVTITKSMSIICDFTLGSVLASGVNGINVNDCSTGTPGTAVVFLSGLEIFGAGTGISGINFTCGKTLHIKNSIIRGFSAIGVNFAPTTASSNVASMVIQDSVVSDNVGGGIKGAPGGGITANMTVTNTHTDRNQFGLRAEDRTKVTVFNSTATSNGFNGFLAVSLTGAAVEMNLVRSVTSNNGTNGIQSNGAAAVVRIQEMSILNNSTGISLVGGTVTSTTPPTTLNAGNPTPGAPNGAPIALQ